MSPLLINDQLTLPAEDLSIRAVRSSGPGGQNVNKVSSKVELRFDLARSRAITDAIRERVRALFPNRLDASGRVLIVSQRTRDQHVNHQDARDKLRDLVLSALHIDKPRKPTKPKRGAKLRRLDEKRRAATKKENRSTRAWS
jgi:ribosome-associated protein